MQVAPLANSSAPGVASACIKNSRAPGSTTLESLPEGSEYNMFLEEVQSRVSSRALEERF